MAIPVDGDLDFQSVNRPKNLPAPVAAGDAVPKSYADAIAQGVIFLPAVVVQSAGVNVAINSPGAALNGVTLGAGNRILLKDQTVASQNGVWVWNGAAVALTRPTAADDFDAGSVHHPGTSVYVENDASIWTMLGNADVTVDTSANTWSQTNGTNDITVSAPLTKTGNNLGMQDPLPLAHGGTGSATAPGARTNLGATGKFATTIGDGTSTTFAVTHNLGTTDVHVTVLDMATGQMELVSWHVVDANTISIGAFGTAPTAAGGAIGSGAGKRVVVVG